MIIRLVAWCVVFACAITSVFASDLVINLAEYKPGETHKLNVGKLPIEQVVLKNTFEPYYFNYSLQIELKQIEPEPFDFITQLSKDRAPCDSLREAIANYKEIRDTQEEWAEMRGEPFIQIMNNEMSSCSDAELISKADAIVRMSTKIFIMKSDELQLRPGEVATIKIHRPGKTWTFVIEKPKGKWLVSYGPVAVMPLFFASDSYYLESANTAGEFIIKKGSKKNVGLKELIPAVFFYWMPFSNRAFNMGLSGGVSYQFNAQNLAAFLGVAVTYNTNLCLNAGIGISKVQLLKDKYAEDMIVKENLDSDQLYDTVYRPNPFVSISFRFGSNPFKQEKKSEGEGQ